MIISNQGFADNTNWILPDRLEKILIRNLEFYKIEFESQIGYDCRSTLTSMKLCYSKRDGLLIQELTNAQSEHLVWLILENHLVVNINV